ncbi:hypothetical protein ACW9H6_05675 [Pseudomonas sp. SDO528_S397]
MAGHANKAAKKSMPDASCKPEGSLSRKKHFGVGAPPATLENTRRRGLGEGAIVAPNASNARVPTSGFFSLAHRGFWAQKKAAEVSGFEQIPSVEPWK